MKLHLESEGHLNCVEIVHKSVAVVVSKLEPLQCHLCSPQRNPVNFRYRIALNQHLTSEHAVPAKMLNCAQSYACDHCDFKTSSNWSFTHHRFNCQAAPSDETRYRCLICSLSFPTKEEVTVSHFFSRDISFFHFFFHFFFLRDIGPPRSTETWLPKRAALTAPPSGFDRVRIAILNSLIWQVSRNIFCRIIPIFFRVASAAAPHLL
jgi:hypothetical protein